MADGSRVANVSRFLATGIDQIADVQRATVGRRDPRQPRTDERQRRLLSLGHRYGF